jgi:hypothetical protein
VEDFCIYKFEGWSLKNDPILHKFLFWASCNYGIRQTEGSSTHDFRVLLDIARSTENGGPSCIPKFSINFQTCRSASGLNVFMACPNTSNVEPLTETSSEVIDGKGIMLSWSWMC